MSALLSILLLSCMIITCYSATFLERQFAVPGHENECYDKENDVFYQKGETMKWNLKFCGRKICGGSDGRNRVFIETHTCGKISAVPPECNVDVNLKLAYPDCCGKLVCQEVHQLQN